MWMRQTSWTCTSLPAFNECRMESHSSNPVLLFMELELRRMKIVTAGGQKKSEPEMIAFVLGNTPEEYKMVTQSAKGSGKSLFKEVQKIYKDFWKQ
jgi:hypothetical protein